jgi:DNA-binding response OmpR family regulator
MIKLLFVEDDQNFAYSVKGGLELLGVYEIRCAENGKEGLKIFKSFAPDVVVTDVEMPVMNGFELARSIRQVDENVIIMMASGLTGVIDLRDGFEISIDDYIKKPYVFNEIHWRTEAILRRIKGSQPVIPKAKNVSGKIKIGKYVFDSEGRFLTFKADPRQKLSPRETDILMILSENRNRTVERGEILQRLWDREDRFTSRSLDVFVSKLRKRLSKDRNISLLNERGIGLVLGVA